MIRLHYVGYVARMQYSSVDADGDHRWKLDAWHVDHEIIRSTHPSQKYEVTEREGLVT